MKNLLKPQWIFLLQCAPFAVLIFLCYQDYQVVHSLLSDRSINLWKMHGIALVIIGIIQAVYGLYCLKKGTQLSLFYGVSSLVMYLSFLGIYFYHINELFPFSIPAWMRENEKSIYPLTFLMPSIIHSLIICVIHLSPEKSKSKAWVNFVLAGAIPAIMYITSVVIIPIFTHSYNYWLNNAVWVVGIISTVLFVFFLLRGTFIAFKNKNEKWAKYQWIWKSIVCILFPILGLLINNGTGDFGITGFRGLFGDFSSAWFYVLAVINGLLLCLPQKDHFYYRAVLFSARCLLLPYTVYFFIVFLPFLPLSVVAVIAFGIGFLMLTPLVLFVIHAEILYRDFNYLKTELKKSVLYLGGAVCSIVIPVVLWMNIYQSRTALHEAMEYVFQPNFEKEYDINKDDVLEAINAVQINKDRSSFSIYGNKLPYISTVYDRVVLNNLTLSTGKINQLEAIFKGVSKQETQSQHTKTPVTITDLKVKSTYDVEHQHWRSWVDLELFNSDKTFRQQEFRSLIDVEPGVFVSNYYLYVNDVKEYGILAEKKAALWVYNNIVRRRKDPGIIHYTHGNQVAFKVFPFSKEQTLKTGFELIHKTPFLLKIKDREVYLGHLKNTDAEISETEHSIYIPKEIISDLPTETVDRAYHFIIDNSVALKSNTDVYVSGNTQQSAENIETAVYKTQIQEFIKKSKLPKDHTYFHLVNDRSQEVSITDDWQDYTDPDAYSGFYAEYAVKHLITENHKAKNKKDLVFIFLTNKDLHFNLKDWTFTGSTNILKLEEGALSHWTHKDQTSDEVYANFIQSKNAEIKYYKDLNKEIHWVYEEDQSVILPKISSDFSKVPIGRQDIWQRSVDNQSYFLKQSLNSQDYQSDWLHIIKTSFETGVLSPFTAYMVVENEAQKAALKRKQEEVLNANKLLDAEDEIISMSEPSYMILILLLLGWFIYRNLKSKKIV